MIVNVEQSSFSGVVLNVSRLVGTKEITGSRVFSISRFNQWCDDSGFFISIRFRFDFLQRIWCQFDFDLFVRKFHTSVHRVPVVNVFRTNCNSNATDEH